MASLLYGAGLRPLECCRLRVKDADLAKREIVVCDGKGGKDRVTPPPIDGACAYKGSLMKMETYCGINGDSIVVLDPPRTETGHDDDGERRQEERFWVEQERLADEEKAERAREMLERMRQKEIEQQRMTAGLCVFCGQPLRIVLRWFRVKKHRGCHSFSEQK